MVVTGDINAGDLQVATVNVALVQRDAAVHCNLLEAAAPLRGNDSQKTPNVPGRARTPPRRENGSTPEAIQPRKVSFCSTSLLQRCSGKVA